MNNLLSYCGLVEVRIGASEKYLPVSVTEQKLFFPKPKLFQISNFSYAFTLLGGI
jgi:hypothetical protein